MNDVVTLLYQDAEGTWQRLELPHRNGTPIKYYLQQHPGLVTKNLTRTLRRRVPETNNYVKIRSYYVPKPGDVVALTPKEW